MLLSLLVAGVATLIQGTPVQTVVASRRVEPAAPRPASADSLRALKTAHRAQESFEFVRKQNLPREIGVGSHHCDVRIGRWCVWNDESNDREPPAESGTISDAREHLLAVLDTIGSRYPSEEWVSSQRVRYLIEAKRFGEARQVAERCTAAGSPYFCHALSGVALHDSGAVAAADSAFTAALAAMPDSTRCKWLDISLLLDDDIADRFSHADCDGKARIADSFWRLTTPLYLRPHDYRNEFLARVTETEMQKNSRATMGTPSDWAFRETAIRYGYDTWFVRDDPAAGSMGEVAVAGYRAGGSGFNFVPDAEAYASPADLQMGDWNLGLRTARTLYGPSYARHFTLLDAGQISLFRRGDSALVVTTYDVSADTAFGHQSLEAGVFAVPVVDSMALDEPVGAVAPNAQTRGVLATMAPWKPMVVSVELLDTKSRSATRARIGVRPPSRMRRVGISDLLMFGPRDADVLPHKLEDALHVALYSSHIRSNQLLGLFWETYGVRAEGEHFDVAVSIERIKEGWMRRTAERLHMATPFSPMKLQWTEMPDRGNGVASRAVTLNLSALQPGHYEITLTVTPPDELPLIAKRQVTVER